MPYRKLATLMLVAGPLGAQNLTGTSKWAASARREIEAATPRGDFERLANVNAMLDRVLTVMPNDPLLLYYKGYALYRVSAGYLGQNKGKEARQVLEEAD